MYVTHYDFSNGQWNVFFAADGRESFIRSFVNVDDANDFCFIYNGANVNAEGE